MANGGGGALEAQQQIAASIPYRNIAQRNPAEQFLSAFYTARQVNAQRQRLEQQLLKMDLDAKFKEQAHELGVARLETMAALQTAEHNRKMQGMEDQMERAAAGMQMKDRIQSWKEGIDQEKMEGTTALLTAAQGLDISDPKFKEKLAEMEITPSMARAAQTPFGKQILAGKRDDYTKMAIGQYKLYGEKRKQFDSEAAKTFGFTDYQMFNHPDWWKPSDPSKSGEKQEAYMWPDRTGKSQWITVPASVRSSWMNRFKELEANRAALPALDSKEQQQLRDETGGAASAAPADPSERQVNTIYRTPKGNFRWDGTQWQVP